MVRCVAFLRAINVIEIAGSIGLDLYSLARRVNGRYGFPNAFVEKALGVRATTRNWYTVTRIAGMSS